MQAAQQNTIDSKEGFNDIHNWTKESMDTRKKTALAHMEEKNAILGLRADSADPELEEKKSPADAGDKIEWAHLCMLRVILTAEKLHIFKDVKKGKDIEDIFRYLVSIPLKYQCPQCDLPGHLSHCCPFTAEIRAQAILADEVDLLDRYTKAVRDHEYALVERS